jgi:hypothetical protein
LKTVRIVACALTIFACASASFSNGSIGIAPAAAYEMTVTEGHIARLRASLHLSAAQLPHWRPVEAALRSYAQRASYQVASAEAGLMQRVRAKAGYALDAVAQARVRSAAQPLIATLTDEQKSAGLSVLSSMGF